MSANTGAYLTKPNSRSPSRSDPRTPAAALQRDRMHERAGRIEHRLEWPVLAAPLLMVPTLAIDQSEAGPPWNTIAVVINWRTWLPPMNEAFEDDD